ncbi:hypothetical protein RFI_12831 [Reticulomyxa filosa]|uniref:Uncharacterized protein n=1 Tax=Reticulomyxa filosa TaxID=46433 RepID=X6NDB9_RETFI|nr:hypothetical protein RFI_12831 [Reticulomyxa filosa]|eukprot:ETO24325.1 hypothetical protein RFI_12831 [Reticulomyxa filosa]
MIKNLKHYKHRDEKNNSKTNILKEKSQTTFAEAELFLKKRKTSLSEKKLFKEKGVNNISLNVHSTRQLYFQLCVTKLLLEMKCYQKCQQFFTFFKVFSFFFVVFTCANLYLGDIAITVQPLQQYVCDLYIYLLNVLNFDLFETAVDSLEKKMCFTSPSLQRKKMGLKSTLHEKKNERVCIFL